jgi:hypothetical protein
MKSKWNKIHIGDFFVADFKIDGNLSIYQKIKPLGEYNAVLLNTGELCCLYTENQTFEKVEVSFDVKYID